MTLHNYKIGDSFPVDDINIDDSPALYFLPKDASSLPSHSPEPAFRMGHASLSCTLTAMVCTGLALGASVALRAQFTNPESLISAIILILGVLLTLPSVLIALVLYPVGLVTAVQTLICGPDRQPAVFSLMLVGLSLQLDHLFGLQIFSHLFLS